MAFVRNRKTSEEANQTLEFNLNLRVKNFHLSQKVIFVFYLLMKHHCGCGAGNNFAPESGKDDVDSQ